MANSVLNRGRYFTIPFGSEANKRVDHIETDADEFDENRPSAILEKNNKMGSNIVKSQYIKWSGLTGSEA